MNPEEFSTPTRSRRGQTFAEFALTLPILLLLLFGVIEFARIFHAWVTLQNSARQAARYAVTGRWDPEVVADAFNYTLPTGMDEDTLRANVLDSLVPCTSGTDLVFTQHWGVDCEPGSDDDQGLREDILRIPSIAEEARIGAAGLAIEPGLRLEGLKNADGDVISDETVGEEERGWFHVWICSTRPGVVDRDLSARYMPSSDRNDRLCEVREGARIGDNQYDAGGPGDAVEIIVFFNHPLITPLGLVDYVQLQARRVMINESFRSTRVVNLPPQLALPTFTPSVSPPPSSTPLPTAIPTITPIPSNTPIPTTTETATATPYPTCDNVTVDVPSGVRFVDNYAQFTIHNDNTSGAVYLSEITMNWEKHFLYPSMYVNQAQFVGRSRFWYGTSSVSPTYLHSGLDNWVLDPPDYALRRVAAQSSATLQLRFANGPSRLSDYLPLSMLDGTTLVLGRTLGGFPGEVSPCVITINDLPTPTPMTNTPTYTPTPDCELFETTFVGFETNGVVHFQIRNDNNADGLLTAFSINWNTYGRTLPPISLDFVSVGGTNAFDPTAVTMWTGPDTSPPAASQEGGAGWNITPLIPRNQIVDIWFDFDGTSGRLDYELGYQRYDFNDTTFEINFICFGETPNQNTPVNTAIPTDTLTPSITPTPSVTNTPGPTRTPTPITPSRTPTPITPSPTTEEPSDTPIPIATDPPIGG